MYEVLELHFFDAQGVPRRVNTELYCVGGFRRFLREFECGYCPVSASLPQDRSRLKTILFDHGLVLLGRECL